MSDLSPPFPLIRDALHAGRVIPFLGSGASLSRAEPDAAWEKCPPTHPLTEAELACYFRRMCEGHASSYSEYIPTAAELTCYLARKTEFPKDESPDLAKVAQYYNSVGGRDALYRELHSIFDCDFPLSPLHSFLAGIKVPLLIVTTNYDDLIERAFLARERAYDVVIHTTDPDVGDQILWWEYGTSKPREVRPNKLDIDLGTTSVIYKMHGAVDRLQADRDQYVITEDDYINFLVRMTKNKAVPSMFAEPFKDRHFLFLGYSLRDWNLRVVLNRIERDLRWRREIISWAVQHEPSALEKRLWLERGIDVYDLTIEKFVEGIT